MKALICYILCCISTLVHQQDENLQLSSVSHPRSASRLIDHIEILVDTAELDGSELDVNTEELMHWVLSS